MTTAQRITSTGIFLTIAVISCTPTEQPSDTGSLRIEVMSTAVSNSFLAYVGGGTNISPPAPLPFQGGGMPMISMSENDDGTTSAFLAGEIKATKETDRLIKVTCKIQNPSLSPQSFKAGDVFLVMGSTRTNDFMAVGLGTNPCAMSDEDRRTVKTETIEIQPNGDRTITYVFALPDSTAKQPAVALGKGAPVTFEISTQISK